MGIKTLKEIKKLGKFAIGEIDVDEIILLKKNARFMRKESFDRLVENVSHDGELSSIPFCYLDQERGMMTVLSGNHRIRSLKASKIKRTVVMYNQFEMSKDEQTKIQLSHNAISGEDDILILKELYDSIEDLREKIATGIDDDMFEDIENNRVSLIESVDIPTVEMVLFFTDNVAERVKEGLKGRTDSYVFMGDRDNYKRYLELSETIQTNYNLLNGSMILEVLLDIYTRYLKEKKNGFDGSMPVDGYKLFAIGGTKMVIKEANASKLRKIIGKFNNVDEMVEQLES